MYATNDDDGKMTINLDLISHQILAKLAEQNYRSKRAQLKVILLEEAKRQKLDISKMVEVKA